MPLELVTLGTLAGVEVHHRPVAGVVWDRGALVRLAEGGVAWSFPLEARPVLAAWGRRLYVGAADTLACIDLRTGAEVWAHDMAGPVSAIDAHADGIEICIDTSVVSFDVYGSPGATVRLPTEGRAVRRVGALRYAATAEAIYRLAAGERPTVLQDCACHSVHERDGALQALAEGAGGTLLVEDDGVPLVWPFPQADRHWLAPWGRLEWAVAPREGRSGVWVVDRRVQTRWHVPLPGKAHGIAVVGRAVAVLLEDRAPVLALTHPDVSEPLLLALDGPAELHGDGPLLYVTHSGSTTMFLVREG